MKHFQFSTAKTPFTEPDVPVFRVKNVTTDTVWIEWVPHVGNNWKMPGAAFYVNFSEHGILFTYCPSKIYHF